MPDPRSKKPSKPFGLVTERQFGVGGGQDAINSQAEDNRRRYNPEPETPAITLPARGQQAPKNPPPPPAAPLDDRFHKNADHYATVAKPHSIVPDPVRLPGRYERIQDAVDFYEAAVIPNFAGDERVIIEIHGGDYTEDVTLSSDRIDLIGIGKPRVIGTFTFDVATAGNFTGGRSDFLGIAFDGVDTFAVDLPAFADVSAGPGAPFIIPTFFDCWIYSKSTAFRSLGKVRVWDSELWMEPDGSYGNLTTPTIHIFSGAHTFWSEFYNCRIAGAVDNRAPAAPVGFPNTGMAWQSTSKITPIDPVYFNYVDSGVMFRHCTIEGWGYNECWQTYHDHCLAYGGYVPGALTGETYCYNSGDSSTGIRGRVFFDQTEVACRYLVEESDMTPGVAANTTDTYLRHFDHLSNGSAWQGALIVGGTNPITTGLAIQGTVYAKISATWREHFQVTAAAETAILLNCDSDTAHYAANGFAFPSLGFIQAIFLNPYRDG